jgi:TetR/AcrR family transcriptional regulator, cholesterol catabolism regulator
MPRAKDLDTAAPRERRNRDQEMIAAALRLFAQKSYPATSVQELADAIGVLKGSIYHYIGSKEDLLFRIFNEAHVENEKLMDELTALEVEPLDRLREYLERSMRITLNNVERTTLYFRDWRHLTGERREILVRHRAQYDRFLRNLIDEVYKAKGMPNHVDLKHVSSFVIGATNWVADWFRPDRGDCIEKIAADYTALALAAILGGERTS